MTSSLHWRHLSRLLVCLGFAVGLRALAAPLPEGFTVLSSGPAWRVGTDLVPDGLGGVAPGSTASFPGNTWSEPGQLAAVGVPVTVPEEGPVVLSFRLAGTFTGPTAGFHFAEVLVGETILFECDVAGGTTAPETVEIDLRRAIPAGGRVPHHPLHEHHALRPRDGVAERFPLEEPSEFPPEFTKCGFLDPGDTPC